ncbi:MAG: UbiA family prenyltransferase [Candidatus Eisenbacteria bacterium]|nr:UbiA family prenyltransferase [Candidatus Eisenbacteria bacterium]
MLGSIFLLGYVLAGGEPNLRGLAAFLILHVCLYGGTTAFNSYYDRDEGPVGGLAAPPPVREELLPFSLGLQFLGLLLAAWIGIDFWATYAAIFLLGIGYSIPEVRWKGRPWPSVLVVSIGQGVLGFDAGASVIRGDRTLIGDPVLALGALLAALITTGIYPLTQIYQIEEDAARGDRTFAVAYGPQACFRLSLALLGLAGILAVVLFWIWFAAWQAVVAGVFVLAVWLRILLWSRRYDPSDPVRTMRRTMLLAYATSGGFGLFLLARLLDVI